MQIYRLKVVHLVAIFVFIYVDIKVASGGTVPMVDILVAYVLTPSILGWAVSFILRGLSIAQLRRVFTAVYSKAPVPRCP
jgi:hypothetical protein